MSSHSEQDDERRRGQFREVILAAFHERGERIAELEAEISEHEEHLRAAMLGIGGADEAPCSRCLPLQAEIVRQGARIAELEELSRLDGGTIIQLNLDLAKALLR